MKKAKTKHNGRRASAGRSDSKTVLLKPQGEAIAKRLAIRAFCLFLLLVPAASTVSDGIQDLVTRSLAASPKITLTDKDVQTRASLLRRVAADTDAVRGLDAEQLNLLFGEPVLVRREENVQSMHFTSAQCALDVYYDGQGRKPAYVEYRLKGTGTAEAHKACLQSLFAGARFMTKPDQPTQSASAPESRV